MDEKALLKFLHNILKNEGLDVSFLQHSEKIPYDNLSLFLGVDSLERPYILNINAQKQILNPKIDTGIFRVVFEIKLPFKVTSSSFSQTSNLIAFLNRFLELPGLELNELEMEVLYRYVWLTTEKGLNMQIVLGIIGMIKLILDLHSTSIESVASGKLSFNELLENALKYTVS